MNPVKKLEVDQKDEMHPLLKKLIERGIPVRAAYFRDAVNNGDDIPENYFSKDSNVSSRRVDMWLTEMGLICFHKGRYFGVPDSTVKFSNFE